MDPITNRPSSGFHYWAFISYSSIDRKEARWLHRAIETYGIPARVVQHGHTTPVGDPPPNRFQPVFRDQAELPASSDLGQALEEALVASRYLIVVCSPNAARSHWVNREIETFIELGRRERILAYIIDGAPRSGDENECFPPALLPYDPLAADARQQGDGRRDARLKLVAGMLGVSFDSLRQRDVQRRLRRLELTISVALVIVIAFAGLAWYASQARQSAVVAEATTIVEISVRQTAQEAEKAQREISLSRQLASQALAAYHDNPKLALLVSILAMQTADTMETRNSLLTLLQSTPPTASFPVGHTGAVYSIAYSPNGYVLASAGEDQEIILWNVTDPAFPAMIGQPMIGHQGPVRTLDFSANRNILASGSDDHTIILWDLSVLTEPKPIGEPLTDLNNAVSAIAISPDGKILAAGSRESAITLWNISNPVTPVELSKLQTQQGDISCLAISPDGKRLASASLDSIILMYDISEPSSPKPLGLPLIGHSGAVLAIAFSPAGDIMASGSDDKTIVLWNATGASSDDPLDPFGDNFLNGTPGQIGEPLAGHTNSVRTLAFSSDGKRLATGSDDHTILIWDVSNPSIPVRIGAPLTGPKGAVQSLAFSPDGKILTSSDDQGEILSWLFSNTSSPLMIGVLNAGQNNPLPVLSFSSNGQILISGAYGANFFRWAIGKPDTPKLVDRPFVSGLENITSIAISQDGKYLAAGQDKTVSLWELSDWTVPSQVGSFTAGLVNPISRLAFQPNGKILASAAGNQILRWDVSTPGSPSQIEPPLAGKLDFISSLAFSSDGKLLVAGSCKQWASQSLFDEDCGLGEILVWDVSETTLPRPVVESFALHTGTVTSLAFYPNQAVLATGSEDQTILLWDLSNPMTPVQMGLPLAGHHSGVASLSFGTDGKILASSDYDGMIYLWSVDPAFWITQACQRALRNFTQDEWKQYISGDPYRKICPEWP